MSALNKLIIGLIMLLVLGAIGIYYDMLPAGSAKQAEKTLTTAARAALDAQGMESLIVKLDGQKAILSGTAPSTEALASAVETVRHARWVGGIVAGGVTMIDTSLVAIAEKKAEASEPVASPYLWSAFYEAKGAPIILSGYVPNEDIRRQIVAEAETLFPDGVIDEMQIAKGMPFAAWKQATILNLRALSRLDSGLVEASDAQFRISGETEDAAKKQQAETLLSRFPQDGLSIASITGPQMPEEIELSAEIMAAATTCQSNFNEMMSKEVINFASGSAVIAQNSYTLLDRLASMAIDCKQFPIGVAGHTDSTGSSAGNLRLSQARAEAVREYLIDKGVADTRITATGYGEARPIADNGSAAGRKLNRRIEFIVSTQFNEMGVRP